MSRAKDIAKKAKKGMGDYSPTDEEQEAYLWGVNNNIRIAPKAASKGPLPNEWYLDIYSNRRWVTSPEKYGRGDIWEQLYKYYIHYYERRKKM